MECVFSFSVSLSVCLSVCPAISGTGATLTAIPFSVGTLTGISWEGLGGSGHGGTLPPTVVAMQLTTVANVGATPSIAETIVDDSATAAAYEAVHTVTSGAISYDLSAQRYWIYMRPESGGSAVTGYRVGWIKITVEL